MNVAAAAQKPLLEARDVVVDYHAHGTYTRALDRVSFSVSAGQSVGIIGESGSGKTTLSRALLGLVPPTRGSVHYGDRDIYSLRDVARYRMLGRDVAMVFQDPRSSLNPRLSVGAVVRDPLHVHRIGTRREQDDRVLGLLTSVGLSEQLADRPIRALSGGQLQRVAVARALALEPRLIVADEPTSALDVSVQAQVLNLLQLIREQRQLALVVISHDIRVVRFLAERIAVMQGGRIVESGTTEQVCDEPRDPYTKTLLAAVPRLRAHSS